jgi:hypothetical protein
MTDQERQLIEGLASRIHNAPAPEIDRDADSVIRNQIGSRPDALYILTQTVLVQEMALNQAKAQIEDLNRKLQERPASSSGNFLGTPANSQPAAPASGQPSWWGSGQSSRQQEAPPPLPQQQYQQQQYAPPPPPQQSGMFSGFLRNAATTAAGVVAGEMAFSALSGLFGHHSSGFGGGSGFLGGASGVSPGSETIINNYYDSPGTTEHSGGGGNQFVDPTDKDTTASADSGRDDSSDDSTTDSSGDDSSYDDDSSDAGDDSSYDDDSGSYDDGGGSFDV